MPDDPDPAAIADTLRALGAATLGEAGGRPMAPRVRPAWPGATLAAPAYPVSCTPGDNLAIHVAITRAPAGAALAVSVGETRELGYWGEVLTTAAEARRLRGLVIDGCVRDSAALAAHGFPVFATGLALPGTTKQRAGTAGAPVAVGGVEVAAGDWLVGDGDGVTVVPASALPEIVAVAGDRAARERGYFAALRDGATTVDLLALDPAPIDGPA